MIWEWEGREYENCAVFYRIKDEFMCRGRLLPIGGLANMSGEFPLRVGGERVRSSEALYQACRFPHRPEWQREILDAPNAMRAKMRAKKAGRKKNHSRDDWDEIRVEVMRWCLRVKLAQHYREFFLKLLRWSAPAPIVEMSKKDRFWGAVRDDDGVLRGANQLGRLLVELRDEAIAWKKAGREAESLRVAPLLIKDFLLLGRPIGVAEPEPAGRAAPV